MSKKGATSSHFDPAKAGAEVHNRREKDLYYVRKDLSTLNQTWEAKGFVSVADARTKVEAKYFAHHVTNKGTHKRLPSNSTPIQETVVVLGANSTMAQLKDFARMVQETWGYTPLGIYMHLDEGHQKAMNRGKWIPNLHAHLIFDSTDEHGDSLKPLSQSQKAKIRSTWEKKEKAAAKKEGREPRTFIEPDTFRRPDFELMQDFAAKALGMERGEKSARRHLDDITFKLEKMTEELAEAKAAKEQVEGERDEAVEQKNEAIAEKNQVIKERDEAIAEKNQVIVEKDKAIKDRDEAKAENTTLSEKNANLQDDIKDKEQQIKNLASQVGAGAKIRGFFGVGPEAAIRQELKDLKENVATKVADAKAEGEKEGIENTKKVLYNATGLMNPNLDKLTVEEAASQITMHFNGINKKKKALDNAIKAFQNIPLIKACIDIIRSFVYHFGTVFSSSDRSTLSLALQGDESKAKALTNAAYYDCGVIGQPQYAGRWKEAERELADIARGNIQSQEEDQTRGLMR